MQIFSKTRRKQFIYLSLTFLIFSAMFLFLEYKHEKSYRINALNKELNGYSELIKNYLSKQDLADKSHSRIMDSLTSILPDKNLRITLINLNGDVLYDSKVSNTAIMENHLLRPEIQQALSDTIGSDVRISATTKIKYFYFAKRFQNYFIRISVVYDIEAKQIIEPKKISLLFILFLFFISSISLILITEKFGKSIATLKKFTIQASLEEPIDDSLIFPENELGNIGQDIVEIYKKLINTKKELILEREKLVRHLNYLEEGIAIFTKEKKPVIYNHHFIQYINLISIQFVYLDNSFFKIEDFEPIYKFIDKHLKDINNEPVNRPSYEILINKNNKIFTVKCIIFQDKSFEILINDTTKPAKRKLLKQQLTDNIAHELKTPVSSIKGYLETILNKKLDRKKQNDFLLKAYSQTSRLARLIEDISTLTKIEEAGNLYKIEKINLIRIISDVIEDLQLKIKEHNIKIELNISEDLEFNGNSILVYSIFRNLFDNTIAYAGNNLNVKFDKYMDDEQNYYFSFSDTGTGVPEQDLSRLFERFYRVDKGRDRKSGGTGLGLAIVKNAIIFHKGEISVRNRNEGGLEFLFSINKNLEQ